MDILSQRAKKKKVQKTFIVFSFTFHHYSTLLQTKGYRTKIQDVIKKNWEETQWKRVLEKDKKETTHINSRSSGVMKKDIRPQTKDREPHWTVGELLWITSSAGPIVHGKCGRVEQCPAQFHHPVKLMIMWTGLFPKIISTMYKVKGALRD